MTADLLAFLIRHEGYSRHPYWPGGQSGVTIGYGYDLGYHTRDQFEADWADLHPSYQEALLPCLGKIKLAAQRQGKKPEVQAVVVTAAQSGEVLARTLPVLEARARTTYPGLELLPRPAQVALCSLIFNRGASLVDAPGSDRRREMREIKPLVRMGDLAGIAGLLRSMKRLWAGQGLAGLLRRRDEEADLVESGLA